MMQELKAAQPATIHPQLKGRWPEGQEFEATLDQDNFVVGRADLFGFWARLIALGGIFMLGTTLMLKRMDRRT